MRVELPPGFGVRQRPAAFERWQLNEVTLLLSAVAFLPSQCLKKFGELSLVPDKFIQFFKALVIRRLGEIDELRMPSICKSDLVPLNGCDCIVEFRD